MKLELLAVCTLVLAGCGADAEGHEPTSPGAAPIGGDAQIEGRSPGAVALAQVDENLARLRALDVVLVGELVVDMPQEATNCYGPCPGSEPKILAAKEDAALRLAKLVPVAETAVKAPSSYLCTELVDANLAALNALHVVEVKGLVHSQPKNSPSCYNLPCPADIEAAKAEDAARAAKLDALARGTANGA